MTAHTAARNQTQRDRCLWCGAYVHPMNGEAIIRSSTGEIWCGQHHAAAWVLRASHEKDQRSGRGGTA